MRQSFAGSCTSYTGPSAERLLHDAAQYSFAHYVEKSLADRGDTAMSNFYSLAIETIRKIGFAAGRMALFCADKRYEFAHVRNDPDRFWPRYVHACSCSDIHLYDSDFIVFLLK